MFPYRTYHVYVVQFLSHITGWEDYPDYCERLGSREQPRWRDEVTGCTVAYPFSDHQLDKAIACITNLRAKGGPGKSKLHRIIDRRSGEVVWNSTDDLAVLATMEAGWIAVSVSLTPQEEQMSDVDQPLHIPRDVLIQTLESRLAEEQAKRAEADAKAAARRQVVLDAVSQLSSDQVANLLNHHIWGDPDRLVTEVEKIVEDGKFVTKALEATPTENSIEKYVRVLALATDKEIEVKPRDPIYPLL